MGSDALGGDMFFYHGSIVDIVKFSNFDQIAGLGFPMKTVSIKDIQTDNNGDVQ